VDGVFQKLVGGSVRALGDVLLDEGFEFGLELDRPTCTLTLVACPVNPEKAVGPPMNAV